MNGGYTIINFEDISLSSTPVKIDGIATKFLSGIKRKAVLLEGVKIGNELKNSMFSSVTVDGNNFVIEGYNGKFTITNTDMVSFDSINTNNYSEDETIVGTWIDGRKVYQKTFNIETPSTADSLVKVIDVSDVDSDIDFYVSIDVITSTDTGLAQVNGNVATSSNVIRTYSGSTDKGIYQNVKGSYVSIDECITLRYVKSSTPSVNVAPDNRNVDPVEDKEDK